MAMSELEYIAVSVVRATIHHWCISFCNVPIYESLISQSASNHEISLQQRIILCLMTLYLSLGRGGYIVCDLDCVVSGGGLAYSALDST
jgi:hypothetical protein